MLIYSQYSILGKPCGLFSREELIMMSTKSNITIMNEPEQKQFKEITGENYIDICLAHGNTAIVTLAEKWSSIYTSKDTIQVSGIYTDNVVDSNT